MSSRSYAVSDSATMLRRDLRHQLLQKSDGTFYLAVWRNTSVAKPGVQSAAPQDEPETETPVTISVEAIRTLIKLGATPNSYIATSIGKTISRRS